MKALSERRLPTVSVVIVSYNTREWLRQCLNSLPAASRSHEMDVVVVDNASTDGSAAMVAAQFPSVRLTQSDVNLGFARAVNLGVAGSKSDFVLLVNPDSYLEPQAIDTLINFASANPQFIICGGRTVSPNGDLDPRSCWAAPTLWSLLCSTLLLSTLRPRSPLFDPEAMGKFARDKVRIVDIVTGCLLLIRMDDWRALGGLDERYFVYGEDADLCLRAATTGRSCAITPDAVMVHIGGLSSDSAPRKQELLLAGRITLLQSQWSGVRARIGQALVVSGVLVRIAAARLRSEDESPWSEVWRRRHNWWQGYPPAGPTPGSQVQDSDFSPGVCDKTSSRNTELYRSHLRNSWDRIIFATRSLLDPRSWLHGMRLLHYYHYTHVGQIGKLRLGKDARLAPNVSLANAERISIGDRSNIGSRCSLWAGAHSATIAIGHDVAFGPNCFLTTSNYGTKSGTPFLDQPKQESDIIVGNRVWLGTGVIVLPGVTIGDDTIVAAGAVVTENLPKNVVAAGVPARVLRPR